MTERYVELIKDSERGASFGFNIKGGVDIGCPVYIWRVEPGTIADSQGIKSGDEILRANGIDFTSVTHSEALKVLKSSKHLNLVMRTAQPTINVGDFRGEFYTWVDKFGNPVNPPKESEILRAPKRLVDLQIDPGQNLGLMIRGGCEYGLGIYVTGVDPGSVAERVGLQRGDEILQVNSRPFTSVTHDKAVQTLKSCRKMTLTVAHVGKIPADLTYDALVKDDDVGVGVGLDFDGDDLLGNTSHSSHHRLTNMDSMSMSMDLDDHEHDGGKSTSVLQMIEEKARTVLTKSEHSRFTFYRLEYSQGFLPIVTFVRILLELLSTPEKYTLLTEVREIIRAEDRALFDELIYKPAGLIGLNGNNGDVDSGYGRDGKGPGGGGGLENGVGGHSHGGVGGMGSNLGATLIDHFPDEVNNSGDLVYLRELRGSAGGNNPGHGGGGGQMGIGSNNPDRVPNDCLSVVPKGDRDQQQHLMPNQNQSSSSPAVRFRVRCQKLKPILGITIEGGINTPHRLARVINVSPDGSAAASNLKPGQVLLSVDGKKLDGLTHEEIARYITESYGDGAKPFIDFVVVENKSNLVVVAGGGPGSGSGSGGSAGHSPLGGGGSVAVVGPGRGGSPAGL